MKKLIAAAFISALLLVMLPNVSDGMGVSFDTECGNSSRWNPFYNATISAELVRSEPNFIHLKFKVQGPNVEHVEGIESRISINLKACDACSVLPIGGVPPGEIFSVDVDADQGFMEIEAIVNPILINDETSFSLGFYYCDSWDDRPFASEFVNYCSLFKVPDPSNCPSTLAPVLATAVPVIFPFAEARTSLHRTAPDENDRVNLTIKVYGRNIGRMFGKEASFTIYKKRDGNSGTGFPKTTFQVNEVGGSYHIELGTNLYKSEVPGTTFIFNFFDEEVGQNFEYETPEMCSLMKARADYCPPVLKTFFRWLLPFQAE